MKTLFDPPRQSEILERISSVPADRHPLWGRLNAPRMIAHLSDQLRMGLEDIPVSAPSGILSTASMSWLMLYVIPWPHGAKGPREAFTTAPASWADDVMRLKELVARFVARGPEGKWPAHPLFGKLSGQDWGVLSYKHFNHHLRQFSA
jgi:hypothetical protein